MRTESGSVPPASKGGRRPTVDAGGAPDRGRWSSGKKTEVVLRVLRGEHIDPVSRQIGVTAHRIARWRDEFLAGGQAALRTREADLRDALSARLKAKIGDLTMDNELLREKIRHLEAGLPPGLRRSRR